MVTRLKDKAATLLLIIITFGGALIISALIGFFIYAGVEKIFGKQVFVAFCMQCLSVTLIILFLIKLFQSPFRKSIDSNPWLIAMPMAGASLASAALWIQIGGTHLPIWVNTISIVALCVGFIATGLEILDYDPYPFP